MKQQIGTSTTGSLSEAVKGFINPSLIILLSRKDKFKKHVEDLEQLYPGIPSIGCICSSYSKLSTIENGVTAIAFSDCAGVATNVILEISSMPVKYINRVQNDIKKIKAESENTICIDFAACTETGIGHDSRLMTTLGSILAPKHISLIGPTVAGNVVSCNGVIYEEACAYAFIKNNGKIISYKETIYKPTDLKMVATKADSKNKALQCFKRINNTDIISILELDDYKLIVNNTVSEIKKVLPNVSGVFSMNCGYRYAFFQQENYWTDYLKTMNFSNNHVGLIALGEHFNSQHVNQTMVCVAFE